MEEPQIRVQEPQSKEVFVSAQGPMVKADRVLSVNIIDNVRIPSFSELEILAQTKSDGTTSDGNRSYMLESNLQNSDLLVARAIVTLGKTVPVRLLNPTGSSINLYSGARVAVLSEVMKIEDNRLEDMNDAVAVSSVSDSNKDTVLEDMLMEIVKGTSLSSHHQDLLLTLFLIIRMCLLGPKMNWVVLICCSMKLLLIVQHLFVNGLDDYPQRK